MSTEFDPYHQWLGIPSEEQPADFYRLLGVKRFEKNPDVLSSAADRQMAHLRTFQTGLHAADSQKLLNEVAAARVCLLDAGKKSAYDQQLRAKLATESGRTTQGLPKAAPVPSVGKPKSPLAPAIDIRTKPPRVAHRPAKKSLWMPLTVAFGFLAALAIVLLLANRDVTQVAEQGSPLSEEASSVRSVGEQARATDHSNSPPTKKTRREASPKVSAKSTPSPTEPPRVDNPQVRSEPPAASDAAEQAGRSSIPPEDEQGQVLKTVREVYQELYAKDDPEEGRALAERLLEQATKSSDATERFVLLQEARDIATKAGDGLTAFRAIDAMAAEFEVDSLEMKTRVLAKGAEVARSPIQAFAVVEQSLILAREAAFGDNFATAGQLIDLAQKTARKARNTLAIKTVSTTKSEIHGLADAYAELGKAEGLLRDKPDDRDANLRVGRYYALIKGDWQRGLPYLTKSGDERLKTLAVRETSPPSSPAEQAQLGDLWAEQAEREDGIVRKHARRRAAFWYQRALPDLSGLGKAATEKKLRQYLQDDVSAVEGRRGDMIGFDQHTGRANSKLRKVPEYVVTGICPVAPSRTGIRCNIYCRPGWKTTGIVEACVDGVTWIQVGQWNRTTISQASKQGGWQAISLSKLESAMPTDEIRVRFKHTARDHSLQILCVGWMHE